LSSGNAHRLKWTLQPLAASPVARIVLNRERHDVVSREPNASAGRCPPKKARAEARPDARRAIRAGSPAPALRHVLKHAQQGESDVREAREGDFERRQ